MNYPWCSLGKFTPRNATPSISISLKVITERAEAYMRRQPKALAGGIKDPCPAITDRVKSLSFGELTQRDKVSLDIFWLKDESLEDSENLPSPDILARDITENLESALEQFGGIYEDLRET